MDGHLLLHVDDKFALSSLGIINALRRKKLLIQIGVLKQRQIDKLKVLWYAFAAVFHLRCVQIGQ